MDCKGPTYTGISKCVTVEAKQVYGTDIPITYVGVDINDFYPTRKITSIHTIGILGVKDLISIKRATMFAEIADKANMKAVYINGKDYNLHLELYEDIDMLLVCSEFEGCGLSILEAGACNIPVISTPVGCALELKNIKTFTTIDEAVKLINELKDDPEDYILNLGNEIRENWNWKVLCNTYWKPIIDKMLIHNDVDFIEIGTSDFDTLIENSENQKGYSIEPIKNYYNSLPDKPNVKKLNIAITSNKTNKTCDIYYIPNDIIISEKLQSWMKGCNCINNYHPQHENYKQFVSIDKIPLINIDDFLLEERIRKIKLLKIDTEGHDCIILQGLYEYLIKRSPLYYPNEIIFESNELTHIDTVDKICTLYNSIGYTIERGYNTSMKYSS